MSQTVQISTPHTSNSYVTSYRSYLSKCFRDTPGINFNKYLVTLILRTRESCSSCNLFFSCIFKTSGSTAACVLFTPIAFMLPPGVCLRHVMWPWLGHSSGSFVYDASPKRSMRLFMYIFMHHFNMKTNSQHK